MAYACLTLTEAANYFTNHHYFHQTPSLQLKKKTRNQKENKSKMQRFEVPMPQSNSSFRALCSHRRAFTAQPYYAHHDDDEDDSQHQHQILVEGRAKSQEQFAEEVLKIQEKIKAKSRKRKSNSEGEIEFKNK